MSKQFVSFSAPEPTIEDMCGTTGHDVSAYIDPDTGWQVCHCGSSTVPFEGEPHDEYTALVASLIDAYVDLLGKEFDTHNNAYASIQKSTLRIEANKVLREETPQRLQALLASLQNTNPELFGSFTHVEEELIDFHIVLGAHLDYLGRKIIASVILGAPVDMSERAALDTHIDENNLGLARTGARLYSLMNKDNREGFSYPEMERQFIVVCPALEVRQDMIQTAANLYNERGLSDETTNQIMEMINSGDEPVRSPLTSGLL